MPLQEFWNDDPDLLWTYRNLYMQKMEQEIELEKQMINYKCWIQGFYNYNAIASAFSKNAKYFEKPIEFNAKPKTVEEKRQELMHKIKEQKTRAQMLLKQRSEKEGQN